MTEPLPDDDNQFEWRLTRIRKPATPAKPSGLGLSNLIMLLLTIAVLVYFFAYLVNRSGR